MLCYAMFAVADPDLWIRREGGHPDPEISGGRSQFFFGSSGHSLV